MANRHSVQKRAAGGRVAYNAVGSNVLKEAAERKRGGKVVKVAGAKGKARLDKRARGGRAGADKSPYSSAKIG